MGARRVPIEKHPGFWQMGEWIVFKYRDQRRRQRWGKARTITAAKKLKAAHETDVARGEHRAFERIGFDEYARRWVKSYQGRTRKAIEEHTRADYEERLERDAIPYFGGMLLTQIGPQDMKEFATHVSKRKRQGRRGKGPLSANTVRLALAPVKALFATAFEDGLIRVNPAAGIRIAVPRPQHDLDDDVDTDVRALRDDELGLLLEQIPKHWRVFFELLAQLGLRVGEAIEVRWRDVDLGKRKLRVRRRFYDGKVGPPKSKFGRRTLTLTPELAAALWRLRKQTRAGEGELVFVGPKGARVDPSNMMSRVLKPAAADAGFGTWTEIPGGDRVAESWVGFHTFRHTCATLLFKAGWNPKQVQLWLGHHKASFTVDTYVHLLDEDMPEPPPLVRRTSGVPASPQTDRDETSRARDHVAADVAS